MKREIDWQTLNAYVDGELPPATMARVATALATDRELARQMAELRRLKSALFASAPGPCPPIDLRLRRRWRPLPVAASVLAAALLITLLAGLPGPGQRDPLGRVAAAHQTWLETPVSAQSVTGRLLKSNLDRLRLDAYIPDLAPAGLRYDGIRRLGRGEGAGLHVGYLGSHGCRVSLVVLPGGGHRLGAGIRVFEHPAGRVYGWRVRDNAFYLMAPRMDPARLAQVVLVVQRMTRAHTPMDRHTTLALNQARTSARPCV